MVVRVKEKLEYSGTLSPSELNTEYDIINLPDQSDTYLVEGYVDLSAMMDGDAVKFKEYVAADGVNQRSFGTYTYVDAQVDPIVRFYTKTVRKDGKYRLTLTQTNGTLRSFPYWFVVLVLEQL